MDIDKLEIYTYLIAHKGARKQVRIMKLTWNFQHSHIFVKGFRKKMENFAFCFWVKVIKIGRAIEIEKFLHEILIKIAIEENSAPKRAISKKVLVTTVQVLDYTHVSTTFFIFSWLWTGEVLQRRWKYANCVFYESRIKRHFQNVYRTSFWQLDLWKKTL